MEFLMQSVQPHVQQRNIIYEGWLYKKGKLNKSWKKRWFILYGHNKLVYFESDNKLTVNGEIEICDIYKIDQPKPINENQSNQDFRLTFSLKTDKRNWTFKALNQNNFKIWIKHISSCALPEIIHYGFLFKLLHKKYHKYYFELNILKQLRYYEDKNKRKYRGIILTKFIKNIELTPSIAGRSCIIKLLMNDNSDHILSAQSNSIRLIWHQKFQEIIKLYVEEKLQKEREKKKKEKQLRERIKKEKMKMKRLSNARRRSSGTANSMSRISYDDKKNNNDMSSISISNKSRSRHTHSRSTSATSVTGTATGITRVSLIRKGSQRKSSTPTNASAVRTLSQKRLSLSLSRSAQLQQVPADLDLLNSPTATSEMSPSPSVSPDPSSPLMNPLFGTKTEHKILDKFIVHPILFQNCKYKCNVNEGLTSRQDIKQCSCGSIKRLIFIMKVYSKWLTEKLKQQIMDFNGMYSFINQYLSKFETKLNYMYNSIGLINDFNHILLDHSYLYIQKYIKIRIKMKCDVQNCAIIKRHYRDKTLFGRNNKMRNALYNGYGNNCKEVNIQCVLDKIHCYLFHSYDTLKCSPDELLQIENNYNILSDNDNNNNDNDKDDEKKVIVDLNKIQLMCIKSVTDKKQMFYKNIISEDRFKLQSSKYNSDLRGHEIKKNDNDYATNAPIEDDNDGNNDDDLDTDTDTDDSDTDSESSLDSDDSDYDERLKKRKSKNDPSSPIMNKQRSLKLKARVSPFKGLILDERLYYWKKYESSMYSQAYIQPKYLSLKEEITSNIIYCISMLQFTDVLNRSMDLSQCIQSKRLSFNGNIYKQYHHQSNFKKITISHLCAINLYCNYNEFRYHFIESFNHQKCLTQNGKLKYIKSTNWKIKHSEYGIQSKLLREVVEIYGYSIGTKSLSYYHIISTEYLFSSTFCKFAGPQSCTNDLSVSLIYSYNGIGLNSSLIINIQKYSNNSSSSSSSYGFNCGWISDCPFESETLFIGGLNYIRLSSIINISKCENYRLYINAMSLIYLFLNGRKPDVKLISNMIQYVPAMGQLIGNEKIKYGIKTIAKRRHHNEKGNNKLNTKMNKIQKYSMPLYIEQLYHKQCISLRHIEIDALTLCHTPSDNKCNYVSIKKLFVNKDYSWVRINLFLTIYINIETIKIHCRLKILLNNESYNKLIEMLSDIEKNAQINNTQRKLNYIEFMQPHKSSITVKNILNKFNSNNLLKNSWQITEKSDIGYYSIIIERKPKDDKDDNCGIM